jgi:hypothetical protein
MEGEWLEGNKSQISLAFMTQCPFQSINVHIGEIGIEISNGAPFEFDLINELNVVKE